MIMKLRGLLLLAAPCMLALAAGCTTTAPRSPRASVEPSLRPLSGEIKHSYLAYWDAWLRASRASNPDEPSLLEHAASPQLDILRVNLSVARQRHQVAKGSVSHRLRGMEPGSGAFRVVDCVDLDHWLLYDATTGRELHQLTDKPSQLAVFTLRQRDGMWRVTDSQVLGGC
jgi:hypothetical protein